MSSYFLSRDLFITARDGEKDRRSPENIDSEFKDKQKHELTELILNLAYSGTDIKHETSKTRFKP